VEGVVLASNAALASTPELLNQAPYGAGWLMRIAVDGEGATAGLLTADDYAALLAEESK
jgi:glycine cleavage system H protein